MTFYWILADQLVEHHPALEHAQVNPDNHHFIFIESPYRSQKLRYHKHKLILLFAAMRHYASELREKGSPVLYHRIEDSQKPQETFTGILTQWVKDHNVSHLVIMEPNEWHSAQAIEKLANKLKLHLEILPSNQFIVPRKDFSQWAGSKKSLLMEQHYRRMRRELGILVNEAGDPEGGSWNYDKDNRLGMRDFKKEKPIIPQATNITHDEVTREVIKAVEIHFPQHPGKGEAFRIPVTRSEARKALKLFIYKSLEKFGPYEDLMIEGEPKLFHSQLSPLLNIGLLSPQECIEAAVKGYEKGAPLSSVEGFIRQILGWREFINGVYWHRMPEYGELNGLEAQRSLPKSFIQGKSSLNCIQQTLDELYETGYNHHIQRLMVLGNYFLIGGFHPKEVLDWYTAMYVDAYDWVMVPNVIGMVLHADGSYLATKPYAAGSGYISKMSNYCQNCQYNPKLKTGESSCPYNSLYWNFFDQHKDRFRKNPRVAMMIRSWEKRSEDDRQKVVKHAQQFLESQN